MPKVPSDRQPRLHRHLPQSFHNAVQARREQGDPHLFTEKKLDAIVSYVSRRPRFHPLGTHLELPNPQEFWSETWQINERNRAARDRSLADRIEKPPLRQRIAQAPPPVTNEPVAEKSSLLDFKKLTNEDLANIFKPKLEATTKRLQIILDLLDKTDHERKHEQSVRSLDKQLHHALDNLVETVAAANRRDLQSLDWGLKSVGNLSFKSLHRNYSRILGEVAYVAEGGYFDWIKA